MATAIRSTSSPWSASARMPRMPRLAADVKCDVCVVGAGIAGMSIAYHLTKAGKKVVVLDDGRVGGGQTEMTTAHLVNELDHRYEEIERYHGADGARLAAESHTAAIETIGAIALEEGIACEYERLEGYLFTATGQSDDILDREYEAAYRTGIVKVSRVDRAPISTFNTGPCLRFDGQAQFHPLKYLAGLARAILRMGGAIHCSTRAERMDGGSPALVQTKGGKVNAEAIVVATNSPVNDLVSTHLKQASYITYAIGMRLPPGSAERALYWDTAEPFHYVRFRPLRKTPGNSAADLLIVGGEDHRSGQADDGDERFHRLEMWTRERFPAVQSVENRWAGQVMDSIDGLAYIGRNPGDHDNVFIVTGDCGTGMTHGAIAGRLISDLILQRQNPWADLYSPSRLRMSAAGRMVKDVANMTVQYGAWMTPGEIESTADVKPNEGAILRRGLTKIAVYRDGDGKLTERSAVCPHLGCIVAWNSVEQTWDCPCHGSRFTATGDVINGPANSPLAETE